MFNINPTTSIKLIHKYNIFDAIFYPPQDTKIKENVWQTCLKSLLKMHSFILKVPQQIKIVNIDLNENMYFYMLIAYLLPMEKHVSEYIISNSLKYQKILSKIYIKVVQDLPSWYRIIDDILNNKDKHSKYKDIAKAIYHSGSYWLYCFLSSLINYSNLNSAKNIKIISVFKKIISIILKHELHIEKNSWNIKPLINGNELKKFFFVKDSPLLSDMIESQKYWLLEKEDQNKATQEECIQHLITTFNIKQVK